MLSPPRDEGGTSDPTCPTISRANPTTVLATQKGMKREAGVARTMDRQKVIADMVDRNLPSVERDQVTSMLSASLSSAFPNATSAPWRTKASTQQSRGRSQVRPDPEVMSYSGRVMDPYLTAALGEVPTLLGGEVEDCDKPVWQTTPEDDIPRHKAVEMGPPAYRVFADAQGWPRVPTYASLEEALESREWKEGLDAMGEFLRSRGSTEEQVKDAVTDNEFLLKHFLDKIERTRRWATSTPDIAAGRTFNRQRRKVLPHKRSAPSDDEDDTAPAVRRTSDHDLATPSTTTKRETFLGGEHHLCVHTPRRVLNA